MKEQDHQLKPDISGGFTELIAASTWVALGALISIINPVLAVVPAIKVGQHLSRAIGKFTD